MKISEFAIVADLVDDLTEKQTQLERVSNSIEYLGITFGGQYQRKEFVDIFRPFFVENLKIEIEEIKRKLAKFEVIE